MTRIISARNATPTERAQPGAVKLITRKEYDSSRAPPSPYAKRLKRPVTIRLDATTIAYFQAPPRSWRSPTKR